MLFFVKMVRIQINMLGEIQMAARGPNNIFGLKDIVNENKRLFGLLLERNNVINDHPNLATPAEKDLLKETITSINNDALEYFALGSKMIDLSNLKEKRANFRESSFSAKKIIGRPSRFEQMMQKIDNPDEHAANQNALIEAHLNFSDSQNNLICYIQGLSFIEDHNDIALLLEQLDDWGILDDFKDNHDSKEFIIKIIELGSIHGVDLKKQAEQIAKVAKDVYINCENVYPQNREKLLELVRRQAYNMPKIGP